MIIVVRSCMSNYGAVQLPALQQEEGRVINPSRTTLFRRKYEMTTLFMLLKSELCSSIEPNLSCQTESFSLFIRFLSGSLALSPVVKLIDLPFYLLKAKLIPFSFGIEFYVSI